jgi:c-di-GMP-binding flagellar brake protein YcgR
MERRERARVNVKLQCRLDRKGRGDHHACEFTENISRTGILIRWENTVAPPAVGDPIVVKLKMPENPVFGPRWMHFRARVVRVTPTHDHSLVAVTGVPVSFRSVRKPLADQPVLSRYVN